MRWHTQLPPEDFSSGVSTYRARTEHGMTIYNRTNTSSNDGELSTRTGSAHSSATMIEEFESGSAGWSKTNNANGHVKDVDATHYPSTATNLTNTTTSSGRTLLDVDGRSTAIGDTSSSFSSSEGNTTKYDDHGTSVYPDTTNDFSGSGTHERTYLGASKSVHEVPSTLGGLQATSENTNGNYSALTTESYEVNSTLSSWRTAITYIDDPTQPSVFTPGSTHPDYDPLTYLDSIYKNISDGGAIAYTFPNTSHIWSPLEDSYFYLEAGIQSAIHKKPVVLWTFNPAGLATGATKKGLFTELFDKVAGKTHLLPDYRMFTTSEQVVTFDTLAKYTTEETYETGDPVSFSTRTVTRSALNGVVDFEGEVESNRRTQTITVAVAGVGTMASQTGPDGSDTVERITHQTQQTGYSNHEFTQQLTTGFWSGTTSKTNTYWSWNSSISKATSFTSRHTLADTVLINKSTVIGAGTNTTAVNLGKISTTTLLVYSSRHSTTEAEYQTRLNRFVENWSTVSYNSYNDFGTDGHGLASNGGTTYSVSQSKVSKYLTLDRVRPNVGTYENAKQKMDIFGGGDGVRYRGKAYPNGYVGWGAGHSVGESLNVHVTATANLVTGEEFSGLSLEISDLETARIHPNMTMFPVKRPLTTFTLPSARKASYAQTVASLGGASVDVTWTSTSSSIGSTGTSYSITVSKSARYAVGPDIPITGDFFFEGGFGAGLGQSGSAGFGLGANFPDAPWSVTIAGVGQASWSQYEDGATTGIATVYPMADAWTEFTVTNNAAVFYKGEPLYTAGWSESPANHFSTRRRYPQ